MRAALGLLALIAMIIAGAWWQWAPGAAAQSSTGTPGVPEIVMISAKWCGYCKDQIVDFKRSGIPMRVLDVDSPEGQRLHSEMNGRGVPVTSINGRVVHGYDRPRLARALAEHGLELR